jgi:hypothetical protein
MHRVDTKKRQAFVLRIVAYVVVLVLSLFTTVVLLYVSLGYRFDSSNGHVTRNGLLLVDNNPEAGQIYLNNQLKDNAAPGRFVLSQGEYALKIARSGYRDWSKTITIAPSGVREVLYPLLIPSRLNTKNLKDITRPYLVSQSKDRKKLLTHTAGSANFLLFTLKSEDATEEASLEMPALIEKENGDPGRFEVVEWALDNKHVLLRQTLPSTKVNLLSYDTAKPSETVNISTIYRDEVPGDIHYIGNDTDEIYGMHGTALKRYSLAKNEAEEILANVRSYQPYGDDTILFDRTTENGGSEVGIYKDSIATVIHGNAPNTQRSLLRLAEFEGHQYFAVASYDGASVTLYRDPLKKPILAKQLPFKTIDLDGIRSLEFSDSAQFLLAQSDSGFATYDLDDLVVYAHSFNFKLESAMPIDWIDSHHIQVKRDDGMAMIMDYDGTNQQELVTAPAGTSLYFASNYESAFRLEFKEATATLQAVPLVVQN